MIRQYDEAQDSLKGVREHHTTLYTQLKEKDAAKRADIPALFKERDTIRKDITDHRDTIRKLRDDFNEKRKEWQNYVRQQKEIKYREWAEQKAKRQAEYE